MVVSVRQVVRDLDGCVACGRHGCPCVPDRGRLDSEHGDSYGIGGWEGDASSENLRAAANDLNMLVCTGGRQRSEAEFYAPYVAAGLTLTRFVPILPLPIHIVEGVPCA